MNETYILAALIFWILSILVSIIIGFTIGADWVKKRRK